MNCSHVQRLLPLYTGDDLPIRKADSVRAHLFECQQCNDLATGYSESLAWVNSAGRIDLDERFFEELRDSVWRGVRAGEKSRSNRRLAWLTLLGSAAAIALIAAIAMFGGRRVEPPVAPEVARETQTRSVDPAALVHPVEKAPSRRVVHRRRPSRVEAVASIPVSAAPEIAGSHNSANAESASPVLDTLRRIEIQTADPTVRIIWLVAEPAETPMLIQTED